MRIAAEWTRVSLSQTDLREGWVAVSHTWLPEKELRRQNFSAWVRVLRADGHPHSPVFRTLRFSPILRRNAEKHVGEIALDWGAWIVLSHGAPSEEAPLPLLVRSAYPWEVAYATLWHPDPTHRLSARVSFFALLLGLAAFI